jgi:branched-chain amino acid transport system permease protein
MGAARSLPGRRMAGTAATFVILGLLALAVAIRAFVGEYGAEIGYRLMLYCALGEAWNLMAGYGGLVSLGSASFVGTGAYVLVTLLNVAHADIAPALGASAIAAGLLAALVAPALFRMRGLYFTIGTLALGEALRLLVINVPFFGGATGFFLIQDLPAIGTLYLYAAGLLLVATAVVSTYTMTRVSIPLRAVRDDEEAAAQIGVRAFRVKFAVFVVASAIMGAAGGIQAVRLGAIEPYGMFGLPWSVDVLALVIIGGLGMRLGPLAGAIFSVLLDELLADFPNLHLAITGLILIAVIRFAPKGICGFLARAWSVLDPLRRSAGEARA